MIVKAIPTTYKNITFKSKLEASYAKLWDKYNIKWKYEPKKIKLDYLSDGIGLYTPDFELNNSTLFEVKGQEVITEKEMRYLTYYYPSLLYFGYPFHPKKQPETITKTTATPIEIIQFKITKISFVSFINLLQHQNETK